MFVWSGGCLYGYVGICMDRWVFVWMAGCLYGWGCICYSSQKMFCILAVLLVKVMYDD